MISCASVWAVVLRHVRMWPREPNILLYSLYWPVLDILLLGFLGAWVQRSQVETFAHYQMVMLLGIVLSQVVGRGSNIMRLMLTEEFWPNNVVNFFSLPLRISEWMCAVVLFYIIMMLIMLSCNLFVIFLLYDVSIYSIVSTYVYFCLPLFFSGLWVGFSCLSINIMLGKRGEQIGQAFVWFLVPFSGAYYPVDILPQWGQKFSACLPMSYVFAGMRGYVMYGQDPMSYLIRGYALSIMYALCAIILFVYCFNRTKIKGLARLAE